MSLQNTNPELYNFFNLILEKISPTQEIMPPLKEKMLLEMEEQFNLFINEKFLENMNEEKQEEYLSILQSNPNPETVDNFLNENLPNISQIMKEAATDFANIYIDAANEENEKAV